MRILQVTPTYYPATRYGGPIRSVHGLCRALAEIGHDVHVATTPVNGSTDSEVPINEPVALDGVSVHYFPTGLGRRLYRSPDMKRWLHENGRSFDVIHSHAVFLWTGWAAADAARSARVPYVISPRGMLDKSLFRARRRLLKTVITQWLDRKRLQDAAAIHVCSKVEENALHAFGFSLRRIIRVSNGVSNIPLNLCKANVQSTTFLSLGRISWKKRLHVLIGALADVPDARLLIAGNDEENLIPKLQASAKALGVADRVKFVGEVGGKEKSELIASARALLIPSLSENFANVALEGMAHGIPVITTPGVGASELLEKHDCGLVCDGSSKQFSQAMARMLGEESLAAEMGQRGTEAVRQHYLWRSIALEFEHEYSELVGSSC